MPFVSRTIEPKYLSRKSLFDENGRSLVNNYELEAIANNTLTNVLRQLASLVLVANDIFEDLAKQLQDVYERSCKLKITVNSVEEKLVECDPKRVTVPESDICTFSLRSVHFKSSRPVTGGLFTAASRPHYLQKLYESAAPTPVHTIRQLDRFRRDGTRSSKFFVCTPVLAGRKKKYKKIDLEIETRKPTAVEDLRRWTSTEALGDITVLPDNSSKIPPVDATEDGTNDEIDHLLPSPEEQMMAVALKFPSSIVAVDISGKTFERMSGLRRSLMVIEGGTATVNGSTRRRTRRRHRERRRNTIAGTSQKEIEQAIAGENAGNTEACEFEPLPPLRSRSTDLFKMPKTALSPTDNLKSHFNSLRNWSKTKLRFINKNNFMESCKPSFQGTDVVDDIGIYEIPAPTGRHRREKDRKQSSSSSAISIPMSTSSIATSLVVKLRETSLQRRHWRKGTNKGQDEPAHSSSGNWSASSESGRTSIASETTAPPKSSTTTSNNSLNHHHHHHHHHPPPSVQSRRRYLNTSTSSSVSEGTLTPDINDMQYHDVLDGETSSVYSCDTEGYYTSFHMDSGLKTLKEEEAALSLSTLQLQDTGPATTSFNTTSSSGSSSIKANQLTAENEYELFGKGSTSTTTSSAGTVCTTLLAGNAYGSTRSLTQFAPAVPERKSSLERKSEKKQSLQLKEVNKMTLPSGQIGGNVEELETTKVVAMIHDSPSPDSGHNTPSSPVETASQNSHSPQEHLELSESDLENCDRNERLRTKTAITTCRIPSMCLITPPQSDDEVNLRKSNRVPYRLKRVPCENTMPKQIIDQNVDGIRFSQVNGGKPLHIQIPKVPPSVKGAADIYAYPDKTKKGKLNTVKTISTNGVLETNIDCVADPKDSLHLLVNGETGYATIKSEIKRTHRSPSPSGGVTTVKDTEKNVAKPSQPMLKPSLLPSNFIERFRDVVSKQKTFENKGEHADYVMVIDSSRSPSTECKHSTKEDVKSEYVSLRELPRPKGIADGPLSENSNDDSLERRKRQGARVTLDSDGKVVYSSDSLRRKKEHTTFVPGKYVRDAPAPSPLLDKRLSKPIRPVNCSGLIRTNSDGKTAEDGSAPSQIGKLIIKAGPRNTHSPAKDIVRIPQNVVIPNPTNSTKRNDKGVRVAVACLGSRDPPEANTLERRNLTVRSNSPSSSSSSSTDARNLTADVHSEEGSCSTRGWMSREPAASPKGQFYSRSGFPRNHPMYWTLPARSVYGEDGRGDPEKRSGRAPVGGGGGGGRRSFDSSAEKHSSSQKSGATEPSHGLSSLKLVQSVRRRGFTCSTPTKEPPRNVNQTNLGSGMSPILKESLFTSRSTMTSEEIFAAIHKSKRKLNIKDDLETRSDSLSSPSPDGSEMSLANRNNRGMGKSDSSPCNSDSDLRAKEPGSRRPGVGTPINSFKKLLLQQGVKNSPSKDLRISAVEQLRLSKQCDGTNAKHRSRTAPNGRSGNQWRYGSPRTDILSSTIPEDCSEAEKLEDSPAWRTQAKNSGSVRREGLDPENLKNSTDFPESTYDAVKPRENKSLEITKQYLQQARKNFFADSVSSTVNRLPEITSRCSCPRVPVSSPKNSMSPPLMSVTVKRQTISLETAL